MLGLALGLQSRNSVDSGGLAVVPRVARLVESGEEIHDSPRFSKLKIAVFSLKNGSK